jgi:hypothetical protein
VGFWDGDGGEGTGGGERYCTTIYNIYKVCHIYAILPGGRFERCRLVALYLVIFYGFGIHQYLFMFFR